MIERRYFNRFYAVFWRYGVGKKGKGSWNFTVKDLRNGDAYGGSEPGLGKASFEKAQAAAIHWVMYRHNVKPKKKPFAGLALVR